MEREPLVIRVALARLRALTRAVFWSVPACGSGLTVTLIFRRLDFHPTGLSNRLVDYGIAVTLLPLALLAIFAAIKTLRWLLLCGWPGATGVYASEETLILRLGPFGTRRYDAARIDVRYPFELSGDLEEGTFESFLPEEEQFANLLPRIAHPDSSEPLNLVMLRYVGGSESGMADALRPVLQMWRAREDQALRSRRANSGPASRSSPRE